MADKDKPEYGVIRPAPDPVSPKPKGSHAPAAESGDPVVHQLLAERDLLQTNREVLSPDPEKVKRELAIIDKQLAEINRQLNELGYE